MAQVDQIPELAQEPQIAENQPQNEQNGGQFNNQPLNGQFTLPVINPVSDGGREARIALRKARIEATRLAKSKPTANQEELSHRRIKKHDNDNDNSGQAKSQIQISNKRIENTRETGNEMATNIRVGVTARESLRRQEEAKKIDLWKMKQDEEIERSAEMYADIEKEWSKLGACKGPYKISELLEEQKKACAKLLESKDMLISEYIAELKAKDDEYVRELKREAEEIDKLVERMDKQYRSYESSLLEEIEQIEKAFIAERTELITKSKREIERLLESRKKTEAKYMEERGTRVEDYMNQLEQLRINDSEEYNLVKIKLETDVQVLEQQLQQMRVTYLLNIEKLEYNYQVLKKREEENGTILGAQKRKINRLADHLNILRIKSVKQEKQYQQENQSLTDDYRHITEQFKELQKKFRHFQQADSKKFKEIWKMNEEEAKLTMRKVLQADRIIHEQQLGMTWEPPKHDLFRNIDPLFFREPHVQSIQEAEITFETEMNNHADANHSIEDQVKESLAVKFHEHRSHSHTMKKTLELLCSEAGFLVEDKLQKLLEPLHQDEQSLMRLDSIFKALGVETVDDIERLTAAFVVNVPDYLNEEEKTKSATELINLDEAELIHPNEVINVIKKFMETGNHNDNDTKREAKAIIRQKTGSTLQEKAKQEEYDKVSLQNQYWERMGNVLHDEKFRTWRAVYNAMGKYHDVLIERYNVTKEIQGLTIQNAELKDLLRKYMQAKVNDDLQISPTEIMLAQAGIVRE